MTRESNPKWIDGSAAVVRAFTRSFHQISAVAVRRRGAAFTGPPYQAPGANTLHPATFRFATKTFPRRYKAIFLPNVKIKQSLRYRYLSAQGIQEGHTRGLSPVYRRYRNSRHQRQCDSGPYRHLPLTPTISGAMKGRTAGPGQSGPRRFRSCP